MHETTTEIERLEALWAGDFGDRYVERNLRAGDHRGPFWQSILARTAPASVLEVGSNVGGNLRWLTGEGRRVTGVDVNAAALDILAAEVPDAEGVLAPARHLPFADGEFELVFTMGVLIHQPDESLLAVMDEMVRCTERFLLAGEYHATEATEVPYRGVDGALFKRDYGALFRTRHPHLRLEDQGFLGRDDGWDDVTWWLFSLGADAA
jgi:pseudaminic acid biosynthesis-associated methylase